MSKKILLVRNAFDKDFGGGERYSVYIAKELKALGYDPIVASRHKAVLDFANNSGAAYIRTWWCSYQNYSGWRIVFLPLYFLWLGLLIGWYLYTIYQLKVDVAHLQSRDDFIAGTVAAKILRRRVVWTDHADLKYIFKNVRIWYKNPVGKLVLLSASLADTVIAVSNSELNLIKVELTPTARVNFVVMYNGVSEMSIKKERVCDEDTTIFVATSRLVPTKGIWELVEATKKLFKDGEKIVTLLIGTGDDYDRLKAANLPCIRLMGYPHNALNLVAGSDIFVHPSYNEGFSISIVEAAMLSMPVIATNAGGNTEIIRPGVTGLLIQPRDTEVLYKAMRYAIHHRAEMKLYGQSLNREYKQHFQLDRIVKNKLIDIYNTSR